MLLVGFLAGAALCFLGNKRLDKVLMCAGIAVILAVVVWAVAATLVETPRETARDGTKRFVAAVVAKDQFKMGEELSPNVTLGMLTKTDILQAATKYAEKWGLTRAVVTSSELEERGTQINCAVTIFSQHEGAEAPPTMKTEWVFTWGQTAEGWKVIQISPVRIGDQDVTAIVRRYFTEKP